MSERILKDFAERAETGVLLPDFEQIRSRGRDLRRTRIAVAGALAVFLLVAGGVVASITIGQRTAPPAEDPNPTELHELDSRPFDYRQQLVPGVDYTFRPWSLDQGTVKARLTVPGRGWIWWGDGLTRPDRDGVLFPMPPERYATVGVMLADRVATTQCRSFHMVKKPEWDAIGPTPLAAVRQIAAVPGVTVRDHPRVDNRFGYPGAHVRLSVPKLCSDTQTAVLWSVFPGEYEGEGVATVRYPGQVMDVWVVDVGGTPVVVYAELSPGLPESYSEEMASLVDSIRLTP